jgi:hypothetical protein
LQTGRLVTRHHDLDTGSGAASGVVDGFESPSDDNPSTALGDYSAITIGLQWAVTSDCRSRGGNEAVDVATTIDLLALDIVARDVGGIDILAVVVIFDGDDTLPIAACDSVLDEVARGRRLSAARP